MAQVSYAPTSYDAGVRQQVATLFNTLILGPENNYSTDDNAYWGTPGYMAQGVTPDGRVYTLGLPNGSAPNAAASGVTIPPAMLLIGALVVAYLVLKG